jgi:hypothetical protein
MIFQGGWILLLEAGVPHVTNMFQINAVRVLITTVTIVVILICTTLPHLHILCSIMSFFPLSVCVCKASLRVWATGVWLWGSREHRG